MFGSPSSSSPADVRPALWHPFADMTVVADRQLVIAKGEGSWVTDVEGNRYLDATAALWYCNIGHGRERLGEVAARQIEVLAGYQIFGDLANEPAVELAVRLRELADLGAGSACFFTSGGSDSIETAAKIARRFWQLAGEPDRTVMIARSGAYHGMHTYGTSLSGIEANATGWGPLVGEVVHVPRDDLAALERALERHEGRVAAVIGEPVQGAAGVYPPPPEYWSGVQDLCRAAGVLLIADEVVTGYGRLGRWFASERYGIVPDLLVTAKGLSSGYAPIGAVVVGPRVVDALWVDGAGPFRHGYTYSGHPASCAVALENLKVLEEEALVSRVAEIEEPFATRLGTLADRPVVAEVRTVGLLGAVDFGEAHGDIGLLDRVVVAARRHGVLTRRLASQSLQISPPFIVTEDELDLMVDGIGRAIEEALDGAPSPGGI